MTIRGNAHMPYNTYESLDDLYYKYYTNQKPYEDLNSANNESDKFSFTLNNYLFFYMDMHKISGDEKWLGLIELTCNHILNNTDEKRHNRGEFELTPLETPATNTNYFQAPSPYALNGIPVPGWSSFDGSEQPRLRCQVLQDGQIIGCLCTLAKYIKEGDITALIPLADEMLSHSRIVINSHDASWRYDTIQYGILIKGTYKYPDRISGSGVFGHPLAYNHCGAFCKAMIICNQYEENTEYQKKVRSFLQFTADTREDLGDRYWWPYVLKTPDSAEDINHGSYSLDMIYEAYLDGSYGVTRGDMVKYTNSVIMANRWPNVKYANEKIDGSGDMPDGERFDIGKMVYLGEFNKEIIKLGKDLVSTNYIAKFSSHFRSCAALLLHTNFIDR